MFTIVPVNPHLTGCPICPTLSPMTYHAPDDTARPEQLTAEPRPPQRRRVRVAWKPVLVLLGTLLLSAALFLIPTNAVVQLGAWGYVGVFVLTLVASAALFIPSPALGAALLAGKAGLNPWVVGLLSGVAAGIGEIAGYLVGYSGSDLAMHTRLYQRVAGWVHRWGALTIFVLAAIPSPIIDMAGLAAGAMRMPFRTYLIACIMGKTLRFTALAWLGRMLPELFAFLR